MAETAALIGLASVEGQVDDLEHPGETVKQLTDRRLLGGRPRSGRPVLGPVRCATLGQGRT